MAAQKGKELLLAVNDGTGTYEVVGGFTSNDFSIDGQAVDTTNKDSAGFKESLSGASNVSICTSASGVFMDDASFERVHAAAIANTHLDARITLPDFMTYTGMFIVTSLSMTGANEDAVQYSISMESAGTIATATV